MLDSFLLFFYGAFCGLIVLTEPILELRIVAVLMFATLVGIFFMTVVPSSDEVLDRPETDIAN